MLKKVVSLLLLLIVSVGCSQSKKSPVENKQMKPNDLINETSPYLLQHAYNPVNWKAWHSESLKLAQKENKLIIISIGYSACHWCHVMEEESFENDTVAKLMNANFVSIKVDREERPDVDQIYMNAVQLLTGSGGWPLNCIALPDGRPVFGGTYFTKSQWIDVLTDISNLYKTNPKKVVAYAKDLTEGVKNSDLITVNKENVLFTKAKIEPIVNRIKRTLDFKNGGQINAPKFPMPSHLNFLLRYSFQYEDKALQNFVETTLTKMANGGIYDQIGGGFSRYSVDDKWHIPHFEKMLYDNAQLVSLYSKAYQLTKNESYKRVVEETLNFINQNLSEGDGSFYSSLDADSKNLNGELEEGSYYAWKKDELEVLLGTDFNLFQSYYNINAKGKWEKDRYILYKTSSNLEFAKKHNITLNTLHQKLKSWKAKLLKERQSREKPRLDDKALTSWNALMLKAYVDAYRAFGNKTYLEKAKQSAKFIKENQLQNDGSLLHNYKNGKSMITGFSVDYAFTIAAFIDLYQATFQVEYLRFAKQLMDYTKVHFLDKKTGMFYFTSDLASDLIARKSEVMDNVMPSSNSVLAENLFKLGHYYSDKTYINMAKQMLKNVNTDLKNAPTAYTNWMNLYLNFSNSYYEVAISGPDALTKLKTLDKSYLPNILIIGSNENSNLPLLENKFIKDETYIYVCVDGTCKLPVKNTTKALELILK